MSMKNPGCNAERSRVARGAVNMGGVVGQVRDRTDTLVWKCTSARVRAQAVF